MPHIRLLDSVGSLSISLCPFLNTNTPREGPALSTQQCSVAELGLRRRILGPSEPFCLSHRAPAFPALPQEVS